MRMKNIMTFEEYASKGFKNQQMAFETALSTANVAVIVAEGGITVDGDELTIKATFGPRACGALL